MDYAALFNSIHPGFFQKAGIRGLPADEVFAEMVMDLREDRIPETDSRIPEAITFGEYHGEAGPLREAIGRVDEEWIQYFRADDRVFCAFDGQRIVSFCILSDWDRHQGLRIGGPGCVGTVPEYRGRGIGLEMVRRATLIFREEGFDISWIHYTHLENWYRKLGYRTVLRWNRGGIMPDRPD